MKLDYENSEKFESLPKKSKEETDASSFRQWQRNIGITEDELESRNIENLNPNSENEKNLSNYSYSDT